MHDATPDYVKQRANAPLNPVKRGAAEELRFCNCAGCREELKSVFKNGERIRSQIAGRIKGRPYCENCLRGREEEEDQPHILKGKS